jgi:hypothetical protein
MYDIYIYIYSQTCIRRSPLGQKWYFKIGDLLKEVHKIFSIGGQEKGELLMQVTA